MRPPPTPEQIESLVSDCDLNSLKLLYAAASNRRAAIRAAATTLYAIKRTVRDWAWYAKGKVSVGYYHPSQHRCGNARTIDEAWKTDDYGAAIERLTLEASTDLKDGRVVYEIVEINANPGTTEINFGVI